jgi:hypothetical protein
VYDRLHAGAWNDGTVYPAPNQRIDIHQSVRELEDAPPLGATPLIVATAGILQDKWLATVPRLEAEAQTRLASLSSNSIHVLDRGKGHQLPDNDPTLVIDATLAVVLAARSGAALPPCETVFSGVATARCLAPERSATKWSGRTTDGSRRASTRPQALTARRPRCAPSER